MSDVTTIASPSPPTKTDDVFALLTTKGAELMKLAQAADISMMNARPGDAVARYQQALAMLNSVWPEAERLRLAGLSETEVEAILSHCGDDQALRASLNEIAYLVINGDRLMGWSLAMALASCAMAAQDFGEAAAHYQSASDYLAGFKTEAPTALSLQADYAGAMAKYATGLDSSMHGQRDEALAQFELAISAIENDLLPWIKVDSGADNPASDDLRDRLLMDLMSIKTTKYMLWLSEQTIAGDFAAGLQVANEVLNQIKETIDLTKNARVSPSLKQQARRMLDANTIVAQAYQAYFEGEELRNHRQWAGANDRYTKAKLRFDQAASMFLGAAQVATASQLHLISDMFVGQGRRSCNENRELWERAESYREAFNEIAARFGVQVNNTNLSSSKAEINQEIVWMNRMEDNTRDNLGKLADSLKSSSVPQEQKDELLGKLSDLLKDNSHGSGFFDKVASFCRSAKPIFDGIATVAGPAVQIFAALHGIPPIPISGLSQV